MRVQQNGLRMALAFTMCLSYVSMSGRTDCICSRLLNIIIVYREEKSLRQVVMVAKFLDDNKPKRHLKSGFPLFQTSSILF